MVAPRGRTNLEVEGLTPASFVQARLVGSVAAELAVPKAVSKARKRDLMYESP